MKQPATLDPGEIRVIKISEDAIKEFLWESVMEHGAALFDLPSDDEESLYGLKFNSTDRTMTLIAHRLTDNDRVDIDNISQSSPCTTQSLFVETPYVVRRL